MRIGGFAVLLLTAASVSLGVTGFMKAAFGFRAAFFFTVFFAMQSPLEDAQASRGRVPRNGTRGAAKPLGELAPAPLPALECRDVFERRLGDAAQRLPVKSPTSSSS